VGGRMAAGPGHGGRRAPPDPAIGLIARAIVYLG